MSPHGRGRILRPRMLPCPQTPPSHRSIVRATLCGVLLLACGINAGCDTASGDFNDLFAGLSPPTPLEAAIWAADFNNPGKQRQGVVLLSNATFGGEEAYVELYRTLAGESPDPLVRAAGIRALGRWGEPDDAKLIAEQLDSEYEQVRLEAAIALQRIHEPSIEDRIWQRLVLPEETETVRIELAIALGQYPTDASFQALCLALDDRSLAINLAAADSLRVLTGRDFGIEAPQWLGWYDGLRRSKESPFAGGETFLYPTFRREVGFFESLAFWDPVTFEDPAMPRGLMPTKRTTYSDDSGGSAPDREHQNLGEGP